MRTLVILRGNVALLSHRPPPAHRFGFILSWDAEAGQMHNPEPVLTTAVPLEVKRVIDIAASLDFGLG